MNGFLKSHYLIFCVDSDGGIVTVSQYTARSNAGLVIAIRIFVNCFPLLLITTHFFQTEVP